jgi:hypothetical protein
MSGADFEAMEYWELGLSDIPEKYLCNCHIDDYAVKQFVDKNSSSGDCDYCGERAEVIDLDSLMRFLMEAVGDFYTDPANFMQYNTREGGYLGTVYDGWDIIGDAWQLEINDDELMDDIRESINTERAWATEAEYYGDEADFLNYGWDYFKDVVKHRARYLFGNTDDLRSGDYDLKPYEILKSIGRLVGQYNLVRKVGAGIHENRANRKRQPILPRFGCNSIHRHKEKIDLPCKAKPIQNDSYFLLPVFQQEKLA